MRLRIASWNINSIRPRVEQLARFVRDQSPDVICLQEIKCQDFEFPTRDLAEAGYPHLRIKGQKGFHGVAIASRLPIDDAPALEVCREGHARSVSAKIAGIEIQNVYVPAGGDVPDRRTNPKFDHKLDFFERMTALLSRREPSAPLVIAGDLNVAPGEFDVWNHKFMSKVVSHTPPETEAMATLRDTLDFSDPVRNSTSESTKLFTWWSYRAADFRASNRGLRLDHLWITPGLCAAVAKSGGAVGTVHDNVRAWERPSDHAPITIDLPL